MTNKEFYNTRYLFDALHTLEWATADLLTWSAYNDDMALEELAELKRKSDELRKKLILLDKEGKLEKGGEKTE